MKGYIHSTESFGTVDGPGIRYVVFLQGCPMRCLYCHNPDTWEFGKGEEREAADILADALRYRSFMKQGGITVTGGEPLTQIEFVTELFELAKEQGIHTCIDTSGITFHGGKETADRFERVLAVTDLVMLDIKHIRPDVHEQLTGHENGAVLSFARYLAEKNTPVWIRHVVVPGLTDKEEDLTGLGRFLGGLPNIKALDILPYHTMGIAKYDGLGIPYPLKDTPAATTEEALRAKRLILAGMKETRRRQKEAKPEQNTAL